MFIRKMDAGEGHICLDLNSFTAVAGAWALGASSSYYFYATVSNSTAPANGDKISFKIYLASGIYKIYHLGTKNSNQGILQFALDGADVHSIDQYNATLVNNSSTSSSNISIARAGLYTLTMYANGKNASSSSYVVSAHQVAFVRVS